MTNSMNNRTEGTSRQKVLIIEENSTVPHDRRVWREALALHRAGYEVSVLCPRGEGREAKGYELLDGVHIYRHPLPKEGKGAAGYLVEYGFALFWQFLYSWWIYLRRGFQVIEGCNPPDTIFLIALPFKLLGVKYVFDHHDANPELYISKFGTKGVFYRALVCLEKLTFRSSDVVISTNKSYRDLAIARGKRSPGDVFIVRNGPDLNSFQSVPPNPELRHGKPYLVGYVGTMNAQDGLDILVDVALHTKNMGRRDVHFTCVGGGPELDGLRKMVRDKGLESMMNFTGRIPDAELLEILSTADVCVNPDRPCEMNDISTMNKIMEYMALGRPIVQFESKEGRFSAQNASLYADPRNAVADFAAKILWLLDNADERRKMGTFGRRRVEQELAWEHSVGHLLEAYQRAFGKKRQGSEVGVRDSGIGTRGSGFGDRDSGFGTRASGFGGREGSPSTVTEAKTSFGSGA
jgi:glycosyltransferase involved in cell wall biosynthesis